MVEGRLTGIVEGVITGWIAAGGGAEPAYLEAVADGGDAFGRTRAEPGEDGRARFAIPIPEAYRDGRMRFFDVRPLGSQRALDGGPVVFDGGLLSALELQPPTEVEVLAEPPQILEGLVRFHPPAEVEGWAFAPAEPERRLELEILAGDRFVARLAADKPMAEDDAGKAGDGRHGFRVDLSKLLRYGPHEMTIRAAGAAEPLPGGRFRTGVFAADGEVDCPGYLDAPEGRALLARLPFEHQAWAALRTEPARLAPRLVNRLRRERAASCGAQSVLLLTLPGGQEITRAAWALQSCPGGRILDAGRGADAIRKAAAEAQLVLFAAKGDVLHPSAAGILSAADEADVVTWPRFCADEGRAGSPGTLLRRPEFDPITARQGAITDSTLAVRGEVLAQAPAPVLEALGQGRMHPLWFWLAGGSLRWRSHPEALTSVMGDWTAPARSELERDEAFYRQLLVQEGGAFSLERTIEDLPTPHVLVPAVRARKTSVLIPFRGRPELTLRCIHSLAGQRLSGELELVLIDNQSAPEEAERVLSGARRMLGPERIVALAYDAPFNHSAENNLGAKAAAGDVLVICNNDVVLRDPALIEQLSAWALRPGIGAVGCRLEDPERGTGSYGHIFTAPSGDPFQPPLRENADPTFGRHVHAVPGNTLALAALARETWEELGGLDATRFPIGYNDVDFMLRASRLGLTHLYLGHVWAEHRRGSSRTGDDEDRQAVQINQAHPEAAQGHLRQLARMAIGRASSQDDQVGEQSSTEDAALIERLEAAMARHDANEQTRADFAEALARAQGLITRLEAELGEARTLGRI